MLIIIIIIIIIIIAITVLPNTLQLLLCCELTRSLYVPITADVKNASVCLTNLAGRRMLHAKFDGKEIKGKINKKAYEAYQPNVSNGYWNG